MPYARESAVGEHEALDEEDDRHTEGAGPRSDENGGERAAEEVAAGAAGDGKVEHLQGEDEGRHEPGQGCLPLVEVVGRLLEADGQRAGAHDPCTDRRRRIEESVGYVHVDPLACVFLHITRICESPATSRSAEVDSVTSMATGHARPGTVSAERLEAFLDAMRAGGLRITTPRRIIARNLLEIEGHVTGQRLAQHVSTTRRRRSTNRPCTGSSRRCRRSD